MERLTKRNEDGYVVSAIECPNGCKYLSCSMVEGYSCNHQCEADVMCKLADYEDLEEQGLLPKFHLGDEFWVVHYDGAVKEKIVMLQQKKNGTWKYRFKDTCDFEENEFGKEFFDNEENANKRWREQFGKYA